jgi:hypothetical protein
LKWLVLTTVILVGLPAARADDTHYQDFLIGTRSVGLGGAFVGLANDPSGLWINPGGLVFARRDDININTSFYGFEFLELDVETNEISPAVDTKEFSFFDDIRAIPVTFGGVIGLGQRRDDKTYPHSISFFVGFPAYRDMLQDREGLTVENNTEQRFFVRHQVLDWTLCAGIGYGHRVNEWLAIGTSIFYINRLLDRKDQSNFWFVPADGDSPEFYQLQTNLLHTGHSLLLSAGARFQLSQSWSIGVSLQAPTIPMWAETKLEVNVAEAQRDAQGEIVTRAERTEFVTDDVSSLHPFNVRVGFAFEYPETLTVTGDIHFYSPVTYRIFERDPEALKFMPVPARIHRRALANFSLGFEYLFIKEMSLAVGGFTNITSTPRIPENPTEEMLPHVNQYGGSIALGYYLKHSLIRLGFVGSYGRGYDVVALSGDGWPGERDLSHVRVKIDRLLIHVYLATTFRY